MNPLARIGSSGTKVAPNPPAPADEGGGGVVCGEFVVKETGTVSKALFIPEGARLNSQKLTSLLAQWKKEPPGILISSDAGTVHPKSFAAPKLVALKSFEKYWEDAQQHASMAGVTGSPVETEDFALGVINNVLFLKLVTIFASVLDSADIANNWILIDRTSSKSPAAELLIEAAMVQTASRPTILVIDSLDRLKKNFRGEGGDGEIHSTTAACIERLEQARKRGVPLGTDDLPEQASFNQFYSVDEFMTPTNFNELPLPRPPEAAHVQPDGSISDRVKWQYHYLATFFGSGTHYIVCDNANDSPDLTSLAPTGYIAANGQGMMFDRLKRRIGCGESLVLLHNTGGVTQAFSSLRRGILSSMPPPEAAQLMESIELVSPEAWSKDFGLPEIHMMKELNQRAPMLLRTTIVAVDVMKDTSEEALSALTCCFQGGGGVPELGLGEAEAICILTAWQRHMTLRDNAKTYEKMADFLQIAQYLLAVVTTLMAIITAIQAGLPIPSGEISIGALVGGDEGEVTGDLDAALLDGMGSGVEEGESIPNGDTALALVGGDLGALGESLGGMNVVAILEWVMIILPIVMGFLGTVRGKVRPREKWSTCLMAAEQIVCQIYFYRLRTERYDVNAPSSSEEEEEVSPKKKQAMMRQLFVDTCTEIYAMAISTEVNKGGALKMNKVAQLKGYREGDRNKLQIAIHTHLRETLYREKPKGGKRRAARKANVSDANKRAKALALAQAQALAAPNVGALGAKSLLAKLPILGKLLGKNKSALVSGTAALNGTLSQQATAAMAQATAAMTGGADDKDEDSDGNPFSSLADDLVSQMDIETYIECRVRRVVTMLEARAPVVSRRFNLCEGGNLVTNTSGALLAILGYSNWIAITVAAASVMLAISDYFYIPAQLAATNRALQDCHNLLTFWDSLSLVQRKQRSVKKRCATTVEGALLAICASRTSVSPALPSEAGVDDDEEEEKKK